LFGNGRRLTLYFSNTAGNIFSVPLHICRVSILLLRERRGTANNGLGTTAKYLQRTTSAAGNGLGTTAKYLRQTASSAAGNGLGATKKYLQPQQGYGLGTTAK
jgi:hypothetical protein